MTFRAAFRSIGNSLLSIVAAGSILFSAALADAADGIGDLGAARVPKDAAFLSSSLRLREQLQRFADSKAYAALRDLPVVKRALEAYEEQASLPGNPLALASVFMELPENKQALELLADLVSNDSFVYGEPSCTTLMQLFRKLQETNQVVGILQMVDGRGGGIDIRLDGFEVEFDDEDEDDEEVEDDDDDDVRFQHRRFRGRAQFVAADAIAVDEETEEVFDVDDGEIGTRMFVKTLVDNIDMIVVPDIVWGFKASKPEVGKAQLKRLEELLQSLVRAVPDLADALDREDVSGADFMTFTVSGESLPWDQLDIGRLAEGDHGEEFEKVLDRLRSLRIVVAIGIVGDRVILSVGDSIDHLRKLVGTKPAEGLLATEPFKPLAAVENERLTGISYLSEPMARAVAPSVEYLRRLAGMSGRLAAAAGAPDAKEDVRALLSKMADDAERSLPMPGPWMSYAFLGESGYEGAAWDWSKNVPVDGSKPLSLLSHAGGAPLAAVAIRAKSDPKQFDDMVSWVEAAEAIVTKHFPGEKGGEFLGRAVKAFGPLVSKFAVIVRTKLLPALADGQVGLVLDAKGRTERLHEELPAAVEPLPLFEPAIVFGVSNTGLFKEGINDLFDLADELLAASREFSPGTIPDDYRIPDPETEKCEAGTIWSFSLESSGLDDQIRPSIALGKDAAVLSMVPRQAERLLDAEPLTTAAKLADFERPLAAAAALDHVRLVAAIEPWVVYGARYAGILRRDGSVDPGTKLGADADDDELEDVLSQVRMVFRVFGCLREAAAETRVEADARVTRWRNVIRDLAAAEAKP